jgi:hypothetical protein
VNPHRPPHRRHSPPPNLPLRPTRICGRLLVGQGDDTSDPTCPLPAHHRGTCVAPSDIRAWITALALHWEWDSYVVPGLQAGFEVRTRFTAVVRHRQTINAALRAARYAAELHRGRERLRKAHEQ